MLRTVPCAARRLSAGALGASLLSLLVGVSCASPPAEVEATPPPDPLRLSHAQVFERLGAHRLEIQTATRSFNGAEPGDELAEEISLRIDAAGQYHLLHENSQEHGREAVFVSGVLFTRHRYGAFLRRDDAREQGARIREQPWEILGALLEPVAHALDVASGGDRLHFAARPSPTRPPKQDFPEKKWRESVRVSKLEGKAKLERGVPVEVDLVFAYEFDKDGKQPRVEIDYHHQLRVESPAIIEPEAEPSPVRQRLVHEERQLLQGLER